MRVNIMEDKTPMYLLMIIGIVAVVAIVYMLTGQSASTNTNLGSGITGNVVADDNAAPVDLSGVGRFIFGIALLGACVYMYKKWD
jgi:hypothetical protein